MLTKNKYECLIVIYIFWKNSRYNAENILTILATCGGG